MQRQPRLPIPEEFSPQLSSAQKISLESSRSRQVSHASKASVASNTSEFIEHKIEEMSSEVECLETLKQGLAQAQDDGDKREKTRITEKLERLRERSATTEEELVTLKRQKKIVAEDLDESKLDHDDLADAYASLIIDKLDSSTAKPKKKKFNQQQFRAAVGARYASSRATKIGSTELYCHVIQGWFSNKEVKAAHLVPKSLRSEELAYLFGVGDVVLTDPRNGITLHRVIEQALDAGNIVIVPSPPTTQGDTAWRCVLVNQEMRENTVTLGIRWKVSLPASL